MNNSKDKHLFEFKNLYTVTFDQCIFAEQK